MSGFDVSSSERGSGRLLLEVALGAEPEGAVERVGQQLRSFIDAIDAGFFFPGRSGASIPAELRIAGASVQALMAVDDLPVTALAVLGGMLVDGRHDDIPVQSARAMLEQREFDLLADSGLRPEAPDAPPFEVEFPEDMGGNPALLVEIEFAQPVPPEVRPQLLATLALWDELTRAYPLDPDLPVEAGGAQALFNDPRTLHHHEWSWDNADAEAWDLIVNLCCVWHGRWPIVRVHFE